MYSAARVGPAGSGQDERCRRREFMLRCSPLCSSLRLDDQHPAPRWFVLSILSFPRRVRPFLCAREKATGQHTKRAQPVHSEAQRCRSDANRQGRLVATDSRMPRVRRRDRCDARAAVVHQTETLNERELALDFVRVLRLTYAALAGHRGYQARLARGAPCRRSKGSHCRREKRGGAAQGLHGPYELSRRDARHAGANTFLSQPFHGLRTANCRDDRRLRNKRAAWAVAG